MLRNIFKQLGRGRKIAKAIYPLYLSKSKTLLSSVENVPFVFLKDDFALYFYLHDRDIYKVMKNHVKKDDYVLDIGAHQGFFTALSANYAGQGGKVFAIEAMPSTFEVLKRNSELANEKGYKIYPYQYAVTDSEGLVDFYSQELSPVNSLIYSWQPDPNLADTPRLKIQVPSITIDKFLLSNSSVINKVDFVKIDVEGAEWSLLQGSSCLLSNFKPRLIVIETGNLGLDFYGKTVVDVIDFMKAYDYELRNADMELFETKDIGFQNNYYFVHKSYLNDL
jgi:FkbM family methyltransferase